MSRPAMQAIRRLQSVPILLSLTGLLACLVGIGLISLARTRILAQTPSTFYTPLSGTAEWVGDWEFSALGADPSESGTERVTIPFRGTDLALGVRRGDYRGYFFIEVDGQPANLLPREERGAYLVLTSPDYQPQEITIPVASHLVDGPHLAEVVVERGWDQWPLMGWRASRRPSTMVYDWALAGLGVLGAASLILLLLKVGDYAAGQSYKRYGPALQARVDSVLVLWPVMVGAVPEILAIVAMLAAAAVFYFSRWPVVTAFAGLVVAGLVFLRLDLGLGLVLATAPFYLHLRPLLGKSFSMVEIAMLLCAGAWALRWAVALVRGDGLRMGWGHTGGLNMLDLAALSFVAVAALSVLFAQYRHVALRELRVLILEPALLYLVLRTTYLRDRSVWRIVDMLVFGGVVVAVIGLINYALGVHVITAEHGFRRLRSVYGSPNSVGLYLGRVLPLLFAVALFADNYRRRLLYGLSILPVGLAILLSFSKGALLLGVPVSLLVLGALAGRRWLWAGLGVTGAVAIVVVALLGTPRFASLLDTSSGTTFFRLQLWRSSLNMAIDHPWLGTGPDNFLYHYRSRYIMPAAWQEPNISQAHDIFLDYVTRMGLVGLAAGIGLQAAFWRLALPLRHLDRAGRRALVLGLMGSMANFLAHGLVDASYFLIDLAFLFFLTLGLTQWLARGGDANEAQA